LLVIPAKAGLSTAELVIHLDLALTVLLERNFHSHPAAEAKRTTFSAQSMDGRIRGSRVPSAVPSIAGVEGSARRVAATDRRDGEAVRGCTV